MLYRVWILTFSASMFLISYWVLPGWERGAYRAEPSQSWVAHGFSQVVCGVGVHCSSYENLLPLLDVSFHAQYSTVVDNRNALSAVAHRPAGRSGVGGAGASGCAPGAKRCSGRPVTTGQPRKCTRQSVHCAMRLLHSASTRACLPRSTSLLCRTTTCSFHARSSRATVQHTGPAANPHLGGLIQSPVALFWGTCSDKTNPHTGHEQAQTLPTFK